MNYYGVEIVSRIEIKKGVSMSVEKLRNILKKHFKNTFAKIQVSRFEGDVFDIELTAYDHKVGTVEYVCSMLVGIVKNIAVEGFELACMQYAEDSTLPEESIVFKAQYNDTNSDADKTKQWLAELENEKQKLLERLAKNENLIAKTKADLLASKYLVKLEKYHS